MGVPNAEMPGFTEALEEVEAGLRTAARRKIEEIESDPKRTGGLLTGELSGLRKAYVRRKFRIVYLIVSEFCSIRGRDEDEFIRGLGGNLTGNSIIFLTFEPRSEEYKQAHNIARELKRTPKRSRK